MEDLQVKGYAKENNYIVVSAQGMHAFMLLTTLLWQDKSGMYTARAKCDIQKKTITITSNDIKYVFENVPLQWDGNIDTHLIYAKHIQDLKESEVI